jgi:hypothetical protein
MTGAAKRNTRSPTSAAIGLSFVGAGCLAALCSSSDPGAADAEPLQPQAQFEAAVRNRSTTPNLILLTVVDDRAGESWIGCTFAPFLVGAIVRGVRVRGATGLRGERHPDRDCERDARLSLLQAEGAR